MLVVAVRSVGWNMGTFREIGGTVRDLPVMLGHQARMIRGALTGEPIEMRQARGKERMWQMRTTAELPRRLAYLLGMAIGTAVANILAQYAYTGQGPQEFLDLLFAWNGRYNKDGTKARVSFPTYTKDIFAYVRDVQMGHPLRTLAHKLHP